MGRITRKLIGTLPLFPRVRNHIFSGSNSWAEWRMVAKSYLFRTRYDDESIIQTYERVFAEKANTDFAFSFGAGRMALYSILEALDVKEGDEIILPAYTCVVVPNAILYRGAIPVYVDIESASCNIDVNKIEEVITSNTIAIFAQHTFGFPCDIAAINDIAKKHNLLVVEDCAHAQGAKYEGQPVGSFGDVAFFSTDHSKVASTFLGGMAITRNPDIANRLRDIQSNAKYLPQNLHRKLLLGFIIEYPLYSSKTYWFGKFVLAALSRLRLIFFWRDELALEKPQIYPFPARLSSVQAQLGLSQLHNLEDNISHRKKVYTIIDKALKLGIQNCDESACLRYSFYVKNRADFESRMLYRWDLGVWFTSVLHGRNEKLQEVGYVEGSCPNAEFAAKNLVNIPTHQRISFKEIERMLDKNKSWIVRNCYESYSKEIKL
ncbi:MAG: aminotransferase class I/II-fold pyridoxal phosphate-dependent enzyme [Oceanospirillaceae bacterium]|nr:aminotransferase class I/II-fold pyridoxal phosphate-dependent enzyme [Oceanospirillaceae bacterium]